MIDREAWRVSVSMESEGVCGCGWSTTLFIILAIIRKISPASVRFEPYCENSEASKCIGECIRRVDGGTGA
jgi:hypothetical protein